MLESVVEAAGEPNTIVWVEGADHFFAGTAQSPDSKLGVMREGLRAWVAETFAV